MEEKFQQFIKRIFSVSSDKGITPGLFQKIFSQCNSLGASDKDFYIFYSLYIRAETFYC
jgi:hypothetical protein